MSPSGPSPTETLSPAIPVTTPGPQDADRLARLHRDIFPNPWSANDFRRLLTETGTLALAATVPGGTAPAGFAIIRRLMDEAEILTLGVLPPFRRRGLGQALVAAISERAAEISCRRIFLEVAEDNPAARNLYERLGYKPVGRRQGYYRRTHGPAIDALILSCDPGDAGADSI